VSKEDYARRYGGKRTEILMSEAKLQFNKILMKRITGHVKQEEIGGGRKLENVTAIRLHYMHN
jgi:hypothetical protein